ncbi:c-type cytochrome domain-containing protein [Lunatibacter salilacus]|uniref:c-type cytochrome domain-containing protein n=1 Tax=Lunatibacter salilacus TaxID=2483804 RepID=UPI00131C9318|nr:c-type cytochrome domain-containing protein [Lunatibacter salilacus]
MKIRLIGIAEGILFAGNVLLLYFLLFESYLTIPVWLQPFGRMHPLMLHFPVALLLLALLMEFFRFVPEYRNLEFYKNFTRYLLLFSVLTALVAALMGIFLSLEEGYAGSAVLDWHKWSGAGLVFLASLLYAFRNHPSYTQNVARIGTGVTAVALVLAGHFGATLTHGENFILGPVLQARTVTVPFEEAQVFDHLILPVLERKCNSCHNPSKSKGELVMTTEEGLLRGGKNGVLFVDGNPEESLLLERIHLPESEEEHMPPSGKPQLTDSEKALLEYWVKANLPIETRVATLPATDSLRMLAVSFLNPTPSEPSYDFPSADPSTVQNLNTEYRSVVPLSKDSPALDVTLFNASKYTPSSLEELIAVSEQVVGLHLAKMPVTDSELKTIGRFENLSRLNLNFSEISGTGLVELAGLKQLRHLSLSGTGVDYASVKDLAEKMPGLRTLTLWNTPLTYAELDDLRRDYPGLELVSGREETAEDMLQLNLPRLANASNIFRDTMMLNIGHPIRDVEIRFTLDGSEPDRENADVFVLGETVLEEGKLVKARAYKEGWLGSEVATFNVYQNRHLPDSVTLLSRLNRVHPANGANTFFDGEMGTFNANSPAWANNWAGFLRNNMELLFRYHEAVSVGSIAMRVLVEPETVIFPPASIEVWGGNDPDNLKLVGKMSPKQPSAEGKPYIELVTCDFPAFDGRYFKVIAKPVEKIPDWSRRKGGAALLLVDEMFVN